MAKHHIYSKFRTLKSILDGQKVYFNKISHAPYRWTLYASVKKDNKWHYTNIKIEKYEKNQN